MWLIPLLESATLFIISNAVFNACVVALLTWVVMPVVTRILHRWLQGTNEKSKL